MKKIKISTIDTIPLVLIIVLFFFISTDVVQAASYAEIKISPNPCIIQENGLCSVNVSWTIPDDTNFVQVWVSMDGGEEKIFACTSGLKQVPWIQVGKIYEFRVYNASSCQSADRTGEYIASASVTGVPAKPNKPPRSIGLSAFQLAMYFTGRGAGGNGSDAYAEIGEAMAEKSIMDARQTGARFMRFFAMGWHPAVYGSNGDLDLWITNPTEYWRRMDKLMDMLDKYDMKAVPVLPSNIVQFPSITRETVGDMIINRKSASYILAKKYVREFINRYKNRSTVYFYEITGEYDSRADMDLKTLCERKWSVGHPLCEPLGKNFTTEQLIGFTTNLASYIRTLDSTRMISSGFAFPRKSAQNLRENPIWTGSTESWSIDSTDEFEKNLEDVHQGFDMITVHFYNVKNPNGTRSNERFGNIGANNANLLNRIKTVADRTGKVLYVGETGDTDPYIKDNSSSPFLQNVLEKIRQLGIPYASPWVWQVYITNPYTTYDRLGTYFNIEPGYTDEVIAKIKSVNTSIGSPPPPLGNSLKDQSPRVVITWPLTGSPVSSSQKVYALASDSDATAVEKVEFLVNGDIVQTLTTPPYTADISGVQSGSHTISVRAYDDEDNTTTVGITIANGTVTARIGPTYNNISPNQSCTFNGQTVAHDDSVTAWQASSVAFGSTCTSQTRQCTDGVLSGTYTNAQCSSSGGSGGGGSTPTIAYSWKMTEWSACTNGIRTKIANCKGSDGNTYTDNICTTRKPTISQSCSVILRNIGSANNTSVNKSQQTQNILQTSACPTLARNLWLGLRGVDVSSLQTFLKSTGDFTYPEITNYYGNVTATAVKKFQCREKGICSGTQNSNGYGVTGPKTRGAITRVCDTSAVISSTQLSTTTSGLTLTRSLYIGTKGEDVKQLQRFLKQIGDFTYPTITGYFGSITASAVQRYQCRELSICSGTPQANGYGVVGPKTRATLRTTRIDTTNSQTFPQP